MHITEDRHSDITLNTVNKIINEWEYYKDFIVDLLIVNSAEVYKNLLSRNGEYEGMAELTCINRLFSISG